MSAELPSLQVCRRSLIVRSECLRNIGSRECRIFQNGTAGHNPLCTTKLTPAVTQYLPAHFHECEEGIYKTRGARETSFWFAVHQQTGRKRYWSSAARYIKLWLGVCAQRADRIHSQLPILNCRLEAGFTHPGPFPHRSAEPWLDLPPAIESAGSLH